MVNPEFGREGIMGPAITPEDFIRFRRAVSEKGLTKKFMLALPDWTEAIRKIVVERGVVRVEDSPTVFLQKFPLWHAFAGSTLNPDTNFPPLTEDELDVAKEVERQIAAFVEEFKTDNGF